MIKPQYILEGAFLAFAATLFCIAVQEAGAAFGLIIIAAYWFGDVRQRIINESPTK